MAEAAEWYDDQRVGLGDRFIDEVEEIIDLLLEFPAAGPELDPRTGQEPLRQFSLRSFPYVLVYAPGEPLLILVVAHTSRMPGYWVDRLAEMEQDQGDEPTP